jgi:hypothetical protein
MPVLRAANPSDYPGLTGRITGSEEYLDTRQTMALYATD